MTDTVADRSSPLRYVSVEARFGWTDDGWRSLVGAAPATWVLDREKLDGESHESMVFLALYHGLRRAFADYSVVGAPLIPRGTATDAFEHYAKIERELRTQLPPPQRALERMVEDLLTEGRVEAAKRALAWLTTGYGGESQTEELQRMIAHAESLPPLTETVATLKATLVILYFMHVRWSSRLTWVVAASGFFWLLIMFSFTMTDYLSRGWVAGSLR